MTEMPSNTSAGAGTHTTPPGVTEELRVLRRSQANRVVAGVLGGLGHRLGVDPLILRIVIAVLTLFGGVGIMLYSLAWLLMPAEGEPASVLDQAIGRREVRDAAAVPLALALGAVFVISSGVIIGSSWYAWMLLILAGAGLFTLLRRQNEQGTPGAAGSVPTPPTHDPYGGSTYEPWSNVPPPGMSAGTPPGGSADSDPSVDSTTTRETTPPGAYVEPSPAESTSSGEPSTVPGGPATSSGGPSTSPGGPPTATGEPSTAMPPPDSGGGWPQGPDWGVPDRERSPYDDVYLQPETEPAPVPPPPPARKRPRSALAPLTVCAALIAVGLVALADSLWTVSPGPLYVAVPLAVVGAGLLIGTAFGRSRGLIVLGFLLSLALVPATYFSLWDTETGTVNLVATPDPADLPTEPVGQDVGEFSYDLSALQLTDDDDVSIAIHLGMGDLTVVVPETADVVVNSSLGMGSHTVFDESHGGIGMDRQFTDLGADGTGGGKLELNIDVGLGEVDIHRGSADQLDDPAAPPQAPEREQPQDPAQPQEQEEAR